MSYGASALSSPSVSPAHLPLRSGETEAIFLVQPNRYTSSGVMYVRETSPYADLARAIYRIRVRLRVKP